MKDAASAAFPTGGLLVIRVSNPPPAATIPPSSNIATLSILKSCKLLDSTRNHTAEIIEVEVFYVMHVADYQTASVSRFLSLLHPDFGSVML